MKFDFTAFTVIAVSVAGSWTGLSIKYDRKLSVLSQKIDTCSKGETASTSTDSDILSQVAEATKLSNQSLETSERVERRLEAETDRKDPNHNDSPFTKDKDGWWVAAPRAMFLIPAGGIVIGKRNRDCAYGKGVLSVDNGGPLGDNCPSGDGSVTFGYHNTAEGISSSITGGYDSTAKGISSSITGGRLNTAIGSYSSITGGEKNVAAGTYSSVTGGHGNTVRGEGATVSGGNHNLASGPLASVSGGLRNTASGKYASVLGGNKKKLNKFSGIFPQ